jgi:SAM-dependent methyltransferase
MSQPNDEHPDRVRLREHFLAGNTPDKWDDLWKDNFLPWDRGTVNPALYDLLVQKKDLIGESFSTDSTGTEKKKRALVPGCGRGYDVLLLASFGYDAVGVDGSEIAITACKELAAGSLDKYPLQKGVKERGSMTFLTGDFFSKAWEAEMPFHSDFEGFDFVYDYTVFIIVLSSASTDTPVSMCTSSSSPTKLGASHVSIAQFDGDFGLLGVSIVQRPKDQRSSLGSSGANLRSASVSTRGRSRVRY